MSGENDVRIIVDAENRSAQAFGEATKGAKTVGDVAAIAGRQVKEMGEKLEDAQTKARRLASAEEVAASRTRELAERMVRLQREIAANGDETGDLTRKLERLQIATKASAIATDDYRRSANRASEQARDQARAYDRVADNARQAARAVALLGAASKLGGPGGGGGQNWLTKLLGMSDDQVKNLTSVFQGLASTPIAGPIAIGAGAAAAVPAASFLGGAAGGAVSLGAAAGGAGLGLAGAWMGQPELFGKKWDGILDRLQKRWVSSSALFAKPLLDSLNEVDRVIAGLPIERVLDLSKGFVAPLVSGAGGGISAAAEGLADFLEHAQPIVDNVGPKLANLGRDIGDSLRAVGLGSEGGAHALGDLVDVIGYVIKAAGIMVLGFENTYEGIRDFAGGAKEAFDTLMPFSGLVDRAAEGLFHIESSSMVAGRALGDVHEAAADAEVGVAGLSAALDELRSNQLRAADAGLALAQGWLDLKKGLDEGKKSFDLTTQAGIDNQEVILKQIENAEAYRQQQVQLTGDVDAANAVYAQNVEQIRAMAYAAGFNKQQVDDLIDSLSAVPPTTVAAVQTPGLAPARDNVDVLHRKLMETEGTYEVNVVVHYRQQGQSFNAPLAYGGSTGAGLSVVNDWRHGATGHASGGAVSGWAGDMAGLGEVIRTPAGSTVIPAGSGRALLRDLATGGGGGAALPSVVPIGSDGSRLGDLLIDLIAVSMRERGGRPELLGVKVRR